jgi:uncharacterized protein, PH0010 family
MLLGMFFSTRGFGQDTPQNRKAYAAGRFYSDNPDSLKAQLTQLFSGSEQRRSGKNPLAIVVPHAGYVYSGEVAASGFNQIDPNHQFERIFIIGSSHTTAFQGVSVYTDGDYETPLGVVKVDTVFAKKLIDENKFIRSYAEPHWYEHGLEVQLPFLQYYLRNEFRIVPIILGPSSSSDTPRKLAAALKPFLNEKNLFVISTDFSHYPSYKNACTTDLATAEAIQTNSPSKLLDTLGKNKSDDIPGLATSLCGWSSVLTLLYMTENMPGVSVDLIQYKNSGDSPFGEKDRVVGYYSIAFNVADSPDKVGDFTLFDKDKNYLLKLARNTISDYIRKGITTEPEPQELSLALKTPCGAFVTLNNDGKLRGCIGRFDPEQPLWKVVQSMAIAAATKDYRFNPVLSGEVDDLEIEISVLTPLKRIKSADEFVLGKQGIYIKKGNQTGTFLPQVADTTGWNKIEFLSHCAQDKAGIGWNGWKSAELYTYEALVFKERK